MAVVTRADLDALIERYQAAWQRADADAAAEVFTPDAVFTSPAFQRYDGREAIARGQREGYAGQMAGTRIAIVVESVRRLRDDLAVVHTASRITRADGSPAFPESHGMLVVDGAAGTARIAAFHNMVPLANARP